MKALLAIAARSAWNRRLTLSLVALCIALATGLLLTLERLRSDVRTSFSQAVSGTDLVVGPRMGSLPLMLHAVFHLGAGGNGMRMDSVRALSQQRAVAWTLPVALGDSHRGRPVLGTTPEYFTRFQYGERQPLRFSQGRAFAGTLDGLYEAVVGAEVAEHLGYRPGQAITLQHGGDELRHEHEAGHDDKPFTIVGVLAPTGTPVDRTVHVSLPALQAIHLEWQGGAPLPGVHIAPEQARKFDLEPKQVSAVLVGLKVRAAAFAVQRWVAEYEAEPLMAVLPGLALDELWQVLGAAERALQAMSALVAAVSLASLVAVVLAGLNERRRELAVLRAVGAGPRHVLGLLTIEAALVTLAGSLLGAVVATAALALAAPWLQARWGIALQGGWWPSSGQALLWAAVVLAGMLAGLIPGLRAYRLSLADGLSPRS
ncbi:MAG: ABC transporter permease [Proteobacteria bacterium]|nr:ABC transporter permease [Pseudomonadota bacterium]